MINSIKYPANYANLSPLHLNKQKQRGSAVVSFAANPGLKPSRADFFEKQVSPPPETSQMQPKASVHACTPELMAKLNKIITTFGKPEVDNPEDGLDSLEQVALTDDFTGLKSKMAFYKDLKSCLEESKKTNKPFKLAMFDLDNFKSVNDFFGHSTGDVFLKTLCKIMQTELEPTGVEAYRYGGEEFVIIFKGDAIEKAADISNNILEKLRTNETLQSFIPEYLKIANQKIMEHQNHQSDYIDVVNLRDDYGRAVNWAKESASKTGDGGFLGKKALDIHNRWCNQTIKLIEKTIKIADESDVEFLKTNLKRVMKTRPKDGGNFYAKELDDYFRDHYDRRDEIKKIETWINCLVSPNNESLRGFKATCGLVKFDSYNKDPKYYVDEVDQLLYRGKESVKGKLYQRDY